MSVTLDSHVPLDFCSVILYSLNSTLTSLVCFHSEDGLNNLCCAYSLSPIQLFATPMGYSLPGSTVVGDSLGKNTGVDCHALLQGIFPGDFLSGIEPRSHALLVDSLQSEPPGKPLNIPENVTSKFHGHFPPHYKSIVNVLLFKDNGLGN